VLVVGAGPAGAATALYLARAGFDVVLVDRTMPPRPKPCGECLSPYASRLLDELGVLPQVLASKPARLAGWRIVAPSGASFTERFDGVPGADADPCHGLALDRSSLDAALVRGALSAGVRLVDRLLVTGLLQEEGRVTGVSGRDDGGARRTLRARFVVGADGLRSRVATALGGRVRPPRVRKLSLTAHLRDVDLARDFGEMHIGRGACLGIAPLSSERGGLTNVTLVLHADGVGGVRADDRFREGVRRFPAVREMILAAEAVGPGSGDRPWLASGPFDRAVRRTAAPGCALVGDAAGYFDPFTGQGICHALLDARTLARLLVDALKGRAAEPTALHSYARRQRRRMREAHALQRTIALIVESPALANFGIAAAARSAALRRSLLAATGDLLPPRALLSPALLLTFLRETLARRRA
jgi:menaquinone-9 beta-reductase